MTESSTPSAASGSRRQLHQGVRSGARSAMTLHGRAATFQAGLVEVGPGVCAYLQPNGNWGESNAGLIIGEDEAALIDTAWDLPSTRSLLASVAAHTSEPITAAIATHGDGDHVNGFQLLPQARLVASAATATDIAHENPAALRRSRAGARLLRAVGVGAPRRFGAYMAGMLSPFDFRGIRLRAPDITFERSHTMDIGGRAVELTRLGPAHTAGDTIVHLPDAAVVFAGDLLFVGVTPNSWSGTPEGWRRALDHIGSLGPEIIIPGHGPVSGVAELELLDRYWRWLEAQIRPALQGGGSVYDLSRDIVLGADFAAQPWSRWECPERTVFNVEIIRRAIAVGTPRPIAHRERAGLMWQVARLHGELSRHQLRGRAL